MDLVLGNYYKDSDGFVFCVGAQFTAAENETSIVSMLDWINSDLYQGDIFSNGSDKVISVTQTYIDALTLLTNSQVDDEITATLKRTLDIAEQSGYTTFPDTIKSNISNRQTFMDRYAKIQQSDS